MVVCENEHTAHKSQDDTKYWITCGLRVFARAQFKSPPHQDVLALWFKTEGQQHNKEIDDRRTA